MSEFKNFEEFFEKATGFIPYPYQVKLANSPIPQAINIPTGTGKTETAVLALWLWHRLKGKSNIPKRLIYCLPRRVLVEQTKDRVNKWLQNLGLEERVKTVLLMGGSDDEELDKYPSKEYIIIGTQDMLISGALNRAYGSSPYRWPVIFGLFNNDCMWVLDEIQIMENGLPTSIQLDAFHKSFGTYGKHITLWMSATLNPEWLKTVNSPEDKSNIYELEPNDYDDALKKRNNATKTLHKADIVLKKAYDKKDVEYLQKLHEKGTVTAIIVNTVKRAQALYHLFREEGIDCKLIHSRFRVAERQKLNEWIENLEEEQDKIIISTQVLEAGVDISVRVLITEIAPWSNMVQRFGRCNRKGTMSKADVYWIDLDENLPYDEKEINHSRKRLEEITGKSISPNKLPEIKEKKIFDSILRKKDLIDLFDTTSDLSGNYTDASRFVRDSKKSLDVGIFWREDVSKKTDKNKEFKPERSEICNVPIYEAKKMWVKDMDAYVWDYAYGQWNRVGKDELLPGQTIMLDSKIGGYSETEGFDHTNKNQVSVIQSTKKEYESHDGENGGMYQKVDVTLEDHTSHVLYEAFEIVKDLEFLDTDMKKTIMISAGYHDIGKLHKTFQDTMNKGISYERERSGKFWAKSAKFHRHERTGFRHEVASALAYLKQEKHVKSKFRDLVAYLIMSHHGKVRLALRSVSRKKKIQDATLLGIKKGDKLPQFSLSESFEIKSVTENKIDEDLMFEFSTKEISIKKDIELDMSLAEMGRDESSEPSWVERTLTLLEQYGPFKMAYLESLIRAADGLASKKENEVNVNA